MKLYPQDLGKWVNKQVQMERSLTIDPSHKVFKPSTALICGAICLILTVWFWTLHIPAVGYLMGFLTICCPIWYIILIVNSQNANKIIQRSLSLFELQYLKERAKDTLLQQYLELVQSVLELPEADDKTAGREVREAVAALATVLEALPPEQKILKDSPASFRAEAQSQLANAQAENDPVIAASLHRRADSLFRQAETATQTLTLVRRNQALRGETGEQIKALQTNLTALRIGGWEAAPELSGLAISIHRVATEANTVALSRAEIDTLFS